MPLVWRLLMPIAFSLSATEMVRAEVPFRPPAVPLVAHNPNLSIWSEANNLTDDVTRHWTHREHALESLIRVDGKNYRLMGTEPKQVPALPQTGLVVTPTRSIYDFENAAVHVTLTFLSPVLPDDFDVLSWPVTYLTWTVRSKDRAAHEVAIYDSVSSALAVNKIDEPVDWSRATFGPLTALNTGAAAPTMLQPAGDDTRINWGRAYLVAPTEQAQAAIAPNADLLAAFVNDGKLPADDAKQPQTVKESNPTLAVAFDLGKVGDAPVTRQAMVGYDEVYSIRFSSAKLRPYWRRNGATPTDLFQTAAREYTKLEQRCIEFDKELTADMTRAGGARYAQIGALAYRQGLAGCGLAADEKGQPLYFTKENTSNGCIATVDVLYPAAPQFLLMGPAAAKALVAPALIYSAAPQWKFSFAPHDLGVYPQATAMVYGGGERPEHESDKMPVEESGNMILLCDAIAKMDGNADFASQWWPQLTAWENYLEKFGNDPEDQLCTDDFMGHLAHNANLSVKAILAVAAYGDLCKMRGDAEGAKRYTDLARADATHWMEAARDGDHYRLAFDRANTWSQKYNLVWDQLLGLNIFPASVAQDEVAYYKHVLQPFGVPLDSRTHLTKTDWSLWSATMAESQSDFEAIVSPIYDYLNRTTARVPFVDSYVTDNIKSDGMHSRPVIGGVFIKLLADQTVWRKYTERGAKIANKYALFPAPQQVTEVVPTSRKEPVAWRYTTKTPEGEWTKPGFDDSSWQEGPGGFGTTMTPGSVVRTTWKTDDIWLRRSITIPADAASNLQFLVHHDEDVEIYVNGVLGAKEAGYVGSYTPMEIAPSALALLQPGATVKLAVHCHQTQGGQYVDVGLATVK